MKTVLAALATMTLLTGCFQAKPSDVAGGGGVETTGGAIASLAGPAQGARVRMIPAGYDPSAGNAFPDSLETFTGADGSWSIGGLAPGLYNLDVWQPGDGTRFFQAGIPVGKGAARIRSADTLRSPSRVRLSLAGARRGILYQPGTAYARRLAYAGRETRVEILDSLPAGTLPPFYLAAADSPSAAPVRLTDSLRTLPGALLDPVANALWLHQGIWRLDTAAAAGLIPSADLAHYPLLLRFTRDNFAFDQAMPHGEDLRFMDHGGNTLPHSIERWDPAGGKGEVWVGMDMSAGKGTAGVTMYWGNAGAVPAESGAVFDTAIGLAAAWHLSEPASNRRDGYADATPTGLGGWGTLMAPDPPDSGLIAGAQAFDGDGSNIRMDPAPLGWAGALLVSAWIRPAFGPDDPERHAILARWEEKDSAGFWLEYAPDIKGLRLGLGLASAGKIALVEAPGLGFAKDEWHHVAAAYDGKTGSLYWDGKVVAQGSPGPAPMADNPRDFLVGAKGDADPKNAELDFFPGRIDEVRIYRSARPLAWLELDFLTQRPGAALMRLDRSP
ncbi:MAG: putative protein of unknown function acetylesterase [Fibrobacteres bacterium]|nr:putative protein of unknown function acetylesterase [Fibrobacterota bacterium]